MNVSYGNGGVCLRCVCFFFFFSFVCCCFRFHFKGFIFSSMLNGNSCVFSAVIFLSFILDKLCKLNQINLSAVVGGESEYCVRV